MKGGILLCDNWDFSKQFLNTESIYLNKSINQLTNQPTNQLSKQASQLAIN